MRAPRTLRRAARDRAGFSLLELIVAVTIMAILVGASIPVASMAVNSKATRATREELDGLQLAVVEYFRDTKQLPSAISDMEIDPGVTGWAGPYLQAFSIDSTSGLSQYAVDAWSAPYQLAATTSSLTITSSGLGKVMGDANDLSVTVDVTPVRREETLNQLRKINLAIDSYNATYLVSDPLPSNYSSLLSKLVAKGYLPSTRPFETDAWGSPFQADPAGAMPVVQVRSTNI